MMMKATGLGLVVIASALILGAHGLTQEEEDGKIYMAALNEATAKEVNKETVASWNYDSNITDANNKISLQVSLEAAKIYKDNWNKTMSYNWQNFEDADLKRQFRKYSILGTPALPEAENQKLLETNSRMQTTYATATVCDYKNRTKCDLNSDPDMVDIFRDSRDPEELKYYWVEWHKAAGAPSRPDYEVYVELYNKAAQANGFKTYAEWWLDAYEVADAEDQFIKLWSTVKPFYLQLHAYIRRQLRLKYGADVVSAKGPIPGHLLGNVWAQNAIQLNEFTSPYPNKPSVDVTNSLVEQNYTAKKIFETAENFYVSINLTKMPETFWEKSIIEKPTDGRDLVCQASAWDFHDGKDFRIKACTEITGEYFQIIHHEMGHIEYFIQYKDQPDIYRDGANPGFQEAIGDTITLSVASPKHLKEIGLLKDADEDTESNINTLYEQALRKIAFLPYGYILDLWRYSVFRGTTPPEDYNCHFWKMREVIQGIEPPVARSDKTDFDPAAKYHIAANTEYMRYYVAFIIQFQFHRSLCELAGQYSPGNNSQPLFNCDIYNSTAAGKTLKKMLSMGMSKPWPDAMEVLTGQREMDSSAILDYFQPLYDWLKTENERTGEYIGWEPSTIEYCSPEQVCRLEGSEFLKKLEKQAGN